MDKVTILLSTFNGERYLSQQLNSIITQTYQNWELIVRDDGSSDGTVSLLNNYSHKDERIQILKDKQTNLGACQSFSKLLENAAQKKYVMFCDQDDVWLDCKIELSMNLMKNREDKSRDLPILIHSDLEVVNEDLEVIEDSYWHYHSVNPFRNKFNQLLIANTVTGCTVLMNSSLIRLIQKIPRQAFMHDWWVALVSAAFGNIDIIEKPLVLYRQHHSNSIGAQKFNTSFVLSKIKLSLKNRKISTIDSSVDQAMAFHQAYKPKLDAEFLEQLNVYINLLKDSFWKRRVNILRYQFFRNGILRNLYLFIRA